MQIGIILDWETSHAAKYAEKSSSVCMCRMCVRRILLRLLFSLVALYVKHNVPQRRLTFCILSSVSRVTAELIYPALTAHVISLFSRSVSRYPSSVIVVFPLSTSE